MKYYNKNNILLRWWRGLDQYIMGAITILISFSLILVTTTSTSVANRIGLMSNYFASRQVIFIILSSFIFLAFSILDKKWVKRIAIVSFIISLISLILVKFYGYEVKGAVRWIKILGFSYQPSEFIKPCFAVVTGWILALKYNTSFPGFKISMSLYLIIACLIITQPDFGMLLLITAIFVSQLFVAGLPIIWLFILAVIGMFGIIIAYLVLPHVTVRINSFLNPNTSDNYQITKSIAAFERGGMYGTGPGEGIVKQHIPDAHTDFIFAVAGEEFGAIICIILILIFTFIVIRTLIRLSSEDDKFVQFAATGIIVQFGLQSIINIGVTLNLLPTKGMTLPFISYGGSSTIATGLAMGMLVALTKRTNMFIKTGVNSFNIEKL